jgi:hypothetical protein
VSEHAGRAGVYDVPGGCVVVLRGAISVEIDVEESCPFPTHCDDRTVAMTGGWVVLMICCFGSVLFLML